MHKKYFTKPCILRGEREWMHKKTNESIVVVIIIIFSQVCTLYIKRKICDGRERTKETSKVWVCVYTIYKRVETETMIETKTIEMRMRDEVVILQRKISSVHNMHCIYIQTICLLCVWYDIFD